MEAGNRACIYHEAFLIFVKYQIPITLAQNALSVFQRVLQNARIDCLKIYISLP